MIEVKVINRSGNKLPEYKTIGASGMDLCADLGKNSIVLHPMQRYLVPTGIYIQIPEGYEGQIRARSGLAINHGITLANCIGTIDEDYTGMVKIALINLGNKPFFIEHGDRIAQIVFAKYEKVEFREVESLSETKRGEGGFNSTGINDLKDKDI